MTGPRHSCGVVGICAGTDVAPYLQTALMIIQHRGQESAGISVFDGSGVNTVKDDGLVNVALPPEAVAGLHGQVGIGHVRYSTTGSKNASNAQPLTVMTNFGTIAVAHNGDITNFAVLKEKYMAEGWSFLTDSDSELVTKIIGRHITAYNDPVRAIRAAMGELDGAYALTILINGRLFAVRDPYGFRPLCVGRLDGGYIAVSESAAIDALHGEFVKDVAPGEICELKTDSYRAYPAPSDHPKAYCMFEWVYFARPDSVLDGREVYDVRRRIGEILAREHPADVDLVMPIPDSGRAHAIGYAAALGVPYEEGFMKNRFAGRTFIMPDQEAREHAVSMKMNPIRSTVEGKRVMIVDDSIVRGTTLKKLVSMLRQAGASEVHVRVGSPPIVAPCYYGVDMKTREQFIAASHTVEEIGGVIGADSIGYISVAGLVEAIGMRESDLCVACVSGRYPTRIEGEVHRFQTVLSEDFDQARAERFN